MNLVVDNWMELSNYDSDRILLALQSVETFYIAIRRLLILYGWLILGILELLIGYYDEHHVEAETLC